MNSSCLVSIIVNSYNGADFINETVDSILGQTYKNIELILVDDGSTDNTWEIMQSYAQQDSRVRSLHQKNSGPSAAREAGYRASGGAYIVLADDDDIWHPNLIEDFIRLSAQYSNAEIIVTYYKTMKGKVEIGRYAWEAHLSEDKLGESKSVSGHELSLMSYEPNAEIHPCALWGVCFKRAFLEKVMEELVKYKEKLPIHYLDDAFSSCIVHGMASEIVLTGQVHILYRVSQKSISHKSTASPYNKNHMFAAAEQAEYYKELGWLDVYEMRLQSYYLAFLRSWFMVYAHEKNEKERMYYLAETRRLYDKYLSDLKNSRHREFYGKIAQGGIWLWNRHPKLWFLLVKILRGW